MPDILVESPASARPALSATTDIPAVAEPETKAEAKPEAKPETKAETKPEAKPEGAEAKGETADAKPEKPEGEVKPEDEPKDQTPAWQKREITKARNRQREAEARAAQLEENLNKALTALDKAAKQPATSADKAADVDPRPKRDAYDDPDRYEADLVAWSARTAAKVTQADIEKAAKERSESEARDAEEKRTRAEVETLRTKWNDAVQKGVDKYPDYVEVAESPDVEITQEMAFALMDENLESGKGFEIAYHLGKHPEEASRIAKLTPRQQAIAIGKLADRLASSAKPNVSKAPTPPKPVGSKSAATEKSRDDMSMEEYAAQRNSQLRSTRATTQ